MCIYKSALHAVVGLFLFVNCAICATNVVTFVTFLLLCIANSHNYGNYYTSQEVA